MKRQLFNNKQFNKALLFALKAHEGQQMKCPKGTPYSAHFVSVAFYALKYAVLDGGKLDFDLLIQAALLHDTIEDTAVTYEHVKEEFGEKVADGIFALTKDERISKPDQMKDCILKIKKQPREIAIVKMSDRLFNIRGRVPSWGIAKQEAYKQEAKMIANELGYACAPLKKDLLEAIDNF